MQVDGGREPYREVGDAVAVDVALQPGAVGGEVAGVAGQRGGADETEGLVSRAGDVGVDQREIDPVVAGREIGDAVAVGSAGGAEAEEVVAAAAGEEVAAAAAFDGVRTAVAVERVLAGAAGQPVGRLVAVDGVVAGAAAAVDRSIADQDQALDVGGDRGADRGRIVSAPASPASTTRSPAWATR